MQRQMRFFGKRRTDRNEREVVKRLPACPLVVLHGKREAELYDCKRILRYERERVLLLCGREEVLICGKGLVCATFSMGTVTVRGELLSVSFCKEGEKQ